MALMAPITYYYLFSIIAVFAGGLYITNAVHYRLKGKTLIGNSYKAGTIEYKKLQQFSSNRNLAIVVAITLLSIVNLLFDIYRLMNFANQEYAQFMFILGPVTVIVIGIIVTIKIYGQFGKGKNKKGLRKDNDSWLS